jgi:hypothetical protein
MGTIVGRNLKLEVALTLGSPVTGATAVSKAYPPQVTDATHGLVNGDVGFWLISGGMVELDEQAFVVGGQTTNDFTMPGLESTNFSTFVAASSTYTMAATWGVISEASSLTIGGGAADAIDDTRLIDIKARSISGNLAAQDVQVSIRPQEMAGAAMQFVKRQAKQTAKCLFKASKNGVILLAWYGSPSLPGMSVSSGQGASGDFSIQVPQFVVEPNVT